jgi:hypothetical protein
MKPGRVRESSTKKAASCQMAKNARMEREEMP